MNELVLIQSDRPSVSIQDSVSITVLDSPDVVSIDNNAKIIVSNSDLPVVVKYSTQKGDDGHTPTNEEIVSLVTIDYLLNKLNGQITSTELHASLSDRMDKIAILESNIFDINTALASSVTEDGLSAILEDYSTLASTTTSIAQTRDALLATFGTNIATALSEYNVSADLYGAIATKIDSLLAGTGNSLGDLSAALQIEQQVRAQTIAPIWLDNKEYQKGETVMIGGLTGTYSGKLYQCVTPLLGVNMGEFPPDSAVNWKLISANLYAQYGVKTDVNGYISGFGLANDGATSNFIVLTDRFSIVSPGKTAKTPFIVDATHGVIIDNGVIKDLTSTNILADSITAASIKTSELIVGTNIAMGPNASIAWGKVTSPPTIPNGTYINASGVYTGTVTANQVNTSGFVAQTANIGDLQVTTLKVGDDAITKMIGASRTDTVNGQSDYLSVTIVATGKPIRIDTTVLCAMHPDSPYSTSILRNGSTIFTSSASNGRDTSFFIDTPAAGTYTYTLRTGGWMGSTINGAMTAWEIKK